MMTIRVGVFGYGTIGKRVADAVMLQKDMELVGVTGHSYNFRMETASLKKIPIFYLDSKQDFLSNNIKCKGNLDNLLDNVDIMVDGTPKNMGKENKEKYYLKKKIKAIFQGGEKPDIAQISFVAQCNYNEALNRDYVRVVSCNTTGLARTLHAIDKAFGIETVHATMIRRGADPGDISRGPINAIIPVLEMPSHHGPDVKTVLHELNIFTTAISVSSTLMHVHSIIADLSKEVPVKDIIKTWKNTPRVRIIKGAEKIRSTAEIIEFARDLGRPRADMWEICLWKDAIGTEKNRLLYMQAIHQEANVIPENIDCIRAMMGFDDAKKSIEMTNKSLGL